MNTGEVIALIKAFGGSGGGSSGGGVLVVHNVNGTLDKTWSEIAEAVSTGAVIILNQFNQYNTSVSYVVGLKRASNHGEKFKITAFTPAEDFATSIINFQANIPDDYPKFYTPEG